MGRGKESAPLLWTMLCRAVAMSAGWAIPVLCVLAKPCPVPHASQCCAGCLLQNFGARDPTAGELASNFSDKVLGNFDTSHIIK